MNKECVSPLKWNVAPGCHTLPFTFVKIDGTLLTPPANSTAPVFAVATKRLLARTEWSAEEDYERMGLEDRKTSVLGVEIPRVEVPIVPGKNVTVVAEVVALNYLVKVYGGYTPAERLNQHLIELMKRKSAARAWVREDTE